MSKRQIILFLFALNFVTIFGQSFQVIGNAYSVPVIQNASCTDASSCFTLTDDLNWQQGGVWDLQSIDLSIAFDATFCMFLGANDGGADGFAFVIRAPGSNSYGQTGGALGYGFDSNGPGISPSIAIEFDTYYNSTLFDIPDDHTQLVLNGNVSSAPAVSAIPLLPSGGNVEDNNFHSARVVWDPVTHLLSMYFDGVLRFSYTNNLVSTVFGGNPQVLWGFTASTGGLTNLQQICFPVLKIDIQDESICETDSTYIHYFHDNLTEYSWKDPNQNLIKYWDNTMGTQLIDTGFYATLDGDYTLTIKFNNHTYTKVVHVKIVELPITLSETLCLNQGSVDLINFFPNPPQNGTWTGASGLLNGFKGSFDPKINPDGAYFYTSDSSSVCPVDFYTLNISVQKVNFNPSITLVPCSETTYSIDFFPAASLGNPSFTYNWILNGIALGSSSNHLDLTLNANAQLDLRLVSNDVLACVFDTSVQLKFISNPQLDLGNDISFCQNVSKTISASGNWLTYKWNDGTSNSSIQVSNSGIYWCEVTSSNSCVFRDSILITVNPLPKIILSPFDSVSCAPLSNIFQVSSDLNGVKFYWFFGDGEIFVNQSSVSKTFTNTGYYDILIKATSINLCESTLILNDVIHVLDSPIAKFSYKILENSANAFDVSFFSLSSNTTSLFWDFNAEGSSTSLYPNFSFPNTFEDSSNIFVTLVASNTECSDTLIKLIKFPEPIIYYVPNSFTPDGNLFNNIFLPVITSGVDLSTYQLQIFNRWGELLFESFDILLGWDGTYEKQLVPDAVYVWQIFFKDKFGEQHAITGFVNMLK